MPHSWIILNLEMRLVECSSNATTVVQLNLRFLVRHSEVSNDPGMREVGSILHITTRTVAYHKYRIMKVLGIKTNAELAKYAVRNRVVGA